ncbi:MIND kinetochore complex component Nnf1 protein [Rutstroemia sp. NJR-2017a BVV2]|nr:MIND kinetochore complex component Nnf1 protein [Rutstroemia sp. NJR-2017a BVV2]
MSFTSDSTKKFQTTARHPANLRDKLQCKHQSKQSQPAQPPPNNHEPSKRFQPTMPTPQTHSPSPSPPPAPPIPLTPGPRARRLTKIYQDSITSSLRSISYPAFSSCFPTIAANAPDALKAVHAQMVQRLERFALDEFAQIMEERRVVLRLNEWESVLESARRRRARGVDGEEGGEKGGEVAPHTLPAPAIISAHLAPIYATQQSQLNAKLQTTQSQNAILAEEIKKQREEIERLLRSVEGVVEDLDRANESFGMEVNGLSREALGAEGILRDV